MPKHTHYAIVKQIFGTLEDQKRAEMKGSTLMLTRLLLKWLDHWCMSPCDYLLHTYTTSFTPGSEN